jgi:hypothetical protein
MHTQTHTAHKGYKVHKVTHKAKAKPAKKAMKEELKPEPYIVPPHVAPKVDAPKTSKDEASQKAAWESVKSKVHVTSGSTLYEDVFKKK